VRCCVLCFAVLREWACAAAAAAAQRL
jgi:hypothetical protein